MGFGSRSKKKWWDSAGEEISGFGIDVKPKSAKSKKEN